MTLKFAPLTPDDCLSWMRIRALSYAGPTNALIHNNQLPVSESSIRGVAEERKKEIGAPNQFHFKIIDTSLPRAEDDPEDNGGRTIAVASWSTSNLPFSIDIEGTEVDPSVSNAMSASSEEKKAETPPFLPPELNLKILSALLDPHRVLEQEIMTSRPYLKLNTLATHPEHERKGAGSMLVKWGVDVADKLGVEAFLMSSMMARPLYEKFGFELVRGIEFDRTPHGGSGIDWHGAMLRKAKTQGHQKN